MLFDQAKVVLKGQGEGINRKRLVAQRSSSGRLFYDKGVDNAK